MCLAVPMEIIEIAGDFAIVEAGKVKYRINISLVENLSIGDYVIVHAGFAINKLDKEDADESLRLFEELNKIND